MRYLLPLLFLVGCGDTCGVFLPYTHSLNLIDDGVAIGYGEYECTQMERFCSYNEIVVIEYLLNIVKFGKLYSQEIY